jgi:hypothetical protein
MAEIAARYAAQLMESSMCAVQPLRCWRYALISYCENSFLSVLFSQRVMCPLVSFGLAFISDILQAVQLFFI